MLELHIWSPWQYSAETKVTTNPKTNINFPGVIEFPPKWENKASSWPLLLQVAMFTLTQGGSRVHGVLPRSRGGGRDGWGQDVLPWIPAHSQLCMDTSMGDSDLAGPCIRWRKRGYGMLDALLGLFKIIWGREQVFQYKITLLSHWLSTKDATNRL